MAKKYYGNKSKFKPKSSYEGTRPGRVLTEEQKEKMRIGREEAEKRRKEEAEKQERNRERMQAIYDMDKKMKNATHEDDMFERYAKKAIKSRRKMDRYKG